MKNDKSFSLHKTACVRLNITIFIFFFIAFALFLFRSFLFIKLFSFSSGKNDIVEINALAQQLAYRVKS